MRVPGCAENLHHPTTPREQWPSGKVQQDAGPTTGHPYCRAPALLGCTPAPRPQGLPVCCKGLHRLYACSAAALAFGLPPEPPGVAPGNDYARKLQDQRQAFSKKRNYDITTKGRRFSAGELVWVFSPKRKKGQCPKLDLHWVGPCRVLERAGKVVTRLPPSELWSEKKSLFVLVASKEQ